MSRITSLGTSLLLISLAAANMSPQPSSLDSVAPSLDSPSAKIRLEPTYSNTDYDYMWPTRTRTDVVRGFDPPEHNWNPGHRGVDLQSFSGQHIVAPYDGDVVFSDEIAGVGVVSIQHPDGIRTTYQPLAQRIKVGESVKKGQEIGTLVAGHNGECLHWGALVARDTYMNPLRLIYGRIVLKTD